MTSEHNRERDLPGPLQDGEFQRIPGIGPGIAQRLHAAGIQTFQHLASLTPEEIYVLLNGMVGMTVERITHQDWPGKAQEFAQQLAADTPPSEPVGAGARQHYASIMIELLQDENYTVRRTRVVHVQSGTKDTWAGWDIARLDRWISDQAAISKISPPPVEALPIPAPAEAPVRAAPLPVASPAATQKHVSPRLPDLKFEEAKVFSPGSDQPGRFLTAGRPFEIHLPFKLTGDVPQNTALVYRTDVQARLVGGQRLPLAQISGPCLADGPNTMIVPVEGLDAGTYRLTISLLLYPASAARPEKEGRIFLSDGGLVHIFARETEVAVY